MSPSTLLFPILMSSPSLYLLHTPLLKKIKTILHATKIDPRLDLDTVYSNMLFLFEWSKFNRLKKSTVLWFRVDNFFHIKPKEQMNILLLFLNIRIHQWLKHIDTSMTFLNALRKAVFMIIVLPFSTSISLFLPPCNVLVEFAYKTANNFASKYHYFLK